MSIVDLTGERVWRTYVGGKGLDIIDKREAASDGHFPEEWMFSTVEARNSGRENLVEGLCKIKNSDELFIDWLKKHPEELGKEHIDKFGTTLGILLKLIDSKERLTVQVHPTKEKARELFNSQFGKTECWYVIATRNTKSCIYLGFKPGVTREYFEELFEKEDNKKMLNCLNKIIVKPGDTYLVCGGVPHAIGSGCLIAEVQEPTDYTIRVERTTPSGFRINDFMCHQGLGFKKMFECFDFNTITALEAEEKYKKIGNKINFPGGYYRNIITHADSQFFTITSGYLNGTVDNFNNKDGFLCAYVINGTGQIKDETKTINLEKNSQIFVGANTNVSVVGHNLEFLVYGGPKI